MSVELGLVNFRSNEELRKEETAQQNAQSEQQRREVWEMGLVGQIRRDWERAKRSKERVDIRLLDCMRRRNGEYSPGKLAQIRNEGGSEIFMELTAVKCRAAAAWVADIILPANEKSWGLEPTPVSDIPKPIQQAIYQSLVGQIRARVEAGEQVDVQAEMAAAMEDVKKRANEAAKKASARMEEEIEDQLAEGGWAEALEEFIEDFTTFPAAILKGPVLQRKAVLSWAEGWEPVKSMEIMPTYWRVSPYDFYPSPEATGCDDAAFLIERCRFTRSALKKTRGVPGYRSDMIDKVLQDHGIGGLRDWLYTDAERMHLEGRGDILLSDAETIDGLIYTGSAIGLKLLQWGMPADKIDPLGEYDIEATLIGNNLVKLVVVDDPLEMRKYHSASFQNVPGAFWGRAIPELMSDIQDVCNATARALVNNLAMASGPMVEVNYDRLAPDEDADIYPWKAWQTKSSSTTGNNPAVRFFQPNSMAGELMTVYNQFEQKADDATNIPRYAYGNEKVGGAGQTMGGLSMLMDAASKGIKAAIRSIDRGVIRRAIEATWMHNMLYNPDTSIKGDCKVIARGSSAILMRERTNLLRQQFLAQTANDVDMQIIGDEGRAKLLKISADELDVPDLVPDTDELQKRKAANSQKQAQLADAMQKLQMENAQLENNYLKAKTAKLGGDIESSTVKDMKVAAETRKINREIAQESHGNPHQDRPAPRPARIGPPQQQLGLQGVGAGYSR